ncbi:hypothetical protein [Vibrio sp. LaRot3]|uniref:hypothetical protein n=1 Tax=Vibrio sp. LaRot3 TaxID=2998829 RepID=UPI0022CE2469|nr:hypothetical protein [Vibrio sp. LaRot3]MDA0149390.1 hypothetical protein [Vibrio sp. LaRot3]
MENKPRLILVTDLPPNSEHSAIDGIYKSSLKEWYDVYTVYFGKDIGGPLLKENKDIFIPYRNRKRDLIKSLGAIINLGSIDHFVVRNLFDSLKQVINATNSFNFKVGFWESFPHSYRRLHQANEEQKSIIRKTIEFAYKSRRENKLINRCDYYFPITSTFKKTFRELCNTPWMPVPMGFDFSIPVDRSQSHDHTPVKLVYIGTIDPLRRLDDVIQGLIDSTHNFELHVYSKSKNRAVDAIKKFADPRVIFHDALPRKELLQRIQNYDIGVSIIPRGKLYDVSSPTKTFEYSALGLAVMINDLPEHQEVYDQSSAFFCPFNKQGVTNCLNDILNLSAKQIANVGYKGQKKVQQKRNYQTTGESIHQFISKISCS